MGYYNYFNWYEFREISIGDTFDFISGTHYDSFFRRCEKISPRKYKDAQGNVYRVGSIHCKVYHVKEAVQ